MKKKRRRSIIRIPEQVSTTLDNLGATEHGFKNIERSKELDEEYSTKAEKSKVLERTTRPS